MFGYENKLAFPMDNSEQKFEDSIGLLPLIDNDKLHHVYDKDFDRFMFHKTKLTTKSGFLEVVCNVLVAKMC